MVLKSLIMALNYYFMKNLFFKLGVLLFVLIGSGCEKEDDINVSNLIGTWIEKAPYNDGICDTIVFRKDNSIGNYFPLEEYEYNLSTNDTLKFFNNEKSALIKCYFEMKNSNELTIYNFVDNSITKKIKNISFSKAENS